MKKDPHYVASLEKAIAKKYGDITVKPFCLEWTDAREQDYQAQIQRFMKKRRDSGDNETIEVEGVLVSKKLVKRKSRPSCSVCDRYIFSVNDQFYHVRFEVCYKCYIQNIEGREDRWLEGWRPIKE